MADSVLGGVVEFLQRFGLYDVVLPFLLTFTVTFAVLEKTRVLGTEKRGSDEVPKSNLNAMVSFVFGLLFVAATKLVAAVNKSIPFIVVLMFAFLSLLILVGMFFKEGDHNFYKLFIEDHKNMIVGVVVIGVLLAFMFGLGWLTPAIGWIARHWNSTVVASIFFGIFMLFLVGFIVKSPSGGKPPEKKQGS